MKAARMKSNTSTLAAIIDRGQPDPKTAWPFVSSVETNPLIKAKTAYTTPRIPVDIASQLFIGDVKPKPGDLMLARVDAACGEKPATDHVFR